MTEKGYWNGGLAVHVLVWARDLRKENVGENCGTYAPSLHLSVSVGVPVKIIVQGIREIMWPLCLFSRQQVRGGYTERCGVVRSVLPSVGHLEL